MDHVFFYITGWVWMHRLPGELGTKMHYGKKSSQQGQCDALDNVQSKNSSGMV